MKTSVRVCPADVFSFVMTTESGSAVKDESRHFSGER